MADQSPLGDTQSRPDVQSLLYSVWQLAQVMGIVLFAVLSFFCAKIYNTVQENGITLAVVKKTQESVIDTLGKMDSTTRLSITRAEHDALAIRVTETEKELADTRAKLEILMNTKRQ